MTENLYQAAPQQSRFQQMSDSIIGRIDEMGTRIDDLEQSIGELIQQAGVEEEGKGGPGGQPAQEVLKD